MTEASVIVTITNELGLHANPVVFRNSSERSCGLLVVVAQVSSESLAPDDPSVPAITRPSNVLNEAATRQP